MWQCRVSPTLGDLEGTHDKVWGTSEYTNDTDPTVFMGIYGLPDFYALWRHKGEKHILWCGTDLLHLGWGYWLEDGGGIRFSREPFAKWIAKYCENYVENEREHDHLLAIGVESKIVPSFLGDVNKFEVCFKPGNKVYTSVSGNDYETYGWYDIPIIAEIHPDIEFHLYGNTGEPFKGKNIFDHGRVPKEQMNEEIKEMQAPLRLTRFDGFSEIIAKGLLMGQYPISPYIKYPHTIDNDRSGSFNSILDKEEPNYEGRNWLLREVNKYPWCQKTQDVGIS